jgi:hypothetical protein
VAKKLREMLGNAMDVKFSERNAELMTWALGFWIASLLGVVGALAALSRLPR